jgi:intein-encoded DNA endonuclease-like protein
LGKIGLDMRDVKERFIQKNSFLLPSYHSFPEKNKEEAEEILLIKPTKFIKGFQNKIADVFYEHYKKQ